MEIPEAYLTKIRLVYPDMRLETLELNQDGMVNDVVIVNRRLVCRFPKHAWAQDLLLHEARVLDLVRHKVALQLPLFERLESSFCSYRFLSGEPLTRNLLLKLEKPQRRRVLGQLGDFLRSLHGIPASEAAAAGVGAADVNRDRTWWLEFYERVQETLFPHLMPYQRAFVREHFAPLEVGELDLSYAPALVNGDLGVYHLLFDPEARRLRGVIDFGTAGVGDPAVDVAVLLMNYGETLVREVQPAYPELTGLLERARFWAGTLELQWAYAGMKSDDKGLLLAHIGGARDLLPLSYRD